MLCANTYGSWVDARTLHKELGVGKDFTTWLKGKISKQEFIENEDWKLDSPKRGIKNLTVETGNPRTTLLLSTWQRYYQWNLENWW